MRAIFPTIIALLSGFVGYSLAMAFKRVLPGPTAGDWLTASSAAVGVVVTILSAVWIEEYRRRGEARRGLRRLRGVLRELEKTSDAAGEWREWDDYDPENEGPINDLQNLQSAIKRYKFVRASIQVTDLSLWEIIAWLDEDVGKAELVVQEEIDRLWNNQNDEKEYEISRKNVSAAIGPLRREYAQERIDEILRFGSAIRDRFNAIGE